MKVSNSGAKKAGSHTPGTLRVILYSHDTQGLGHTRRNLALAHALTGSFRHLLEAMAMGVVCIGSDVTGIPEVLGGTDDASTGLFVRAGNVGDLIQALQMVASDLFDRVGRGFTCPTS